MKLLVLGLTVTFLWSLGLVGVTQSHLGYKKEGEEQGTVLGA